MADRQPDSPTAPSEAGPGDQAASEDAPPGALSRLRAVGATLTSRRQSIVRELSTVTAESDELVRAVSHIDSRLSKLAARQRVLEARRVTLHSDARRGLRTAIWTAMAADQAAVASHEGHRRIAVAWLISLTADDNHNWSAEIWAPVAEHREGSRTEVALWEAVVSASESVCQALHGRRGLPESIAGHGLVGMRVQAPKGWSRDQLSDTLTEVIDRVRVQAVPLHQLRCEVSVVWLDLPRIPERPAAREDDADTLIGNGAV